MNGTELKGKIGRINMRITKKIKTKNVDSYVLSKKEDFTENIYGAVQKLGKFEDLEEEIGCPLDVVFKVLKNGFYDENGNWYNDYDFNLKYDWLLSNPNDKYLIFDVPKTYFAFKLKDYKKTWWLKKDRSE